MLILGQAGTGKTTKLKAIKNMIEMKGKTVKMTASTDIAATLLGPGATIHVRWHFRWPFYR